MRFLYWGIACAIASSGVAVTNSVLGPSSSQVDKAEIPSPYNAGQPIGSGLVARPELATKTEYELPSATPYVSSNPNIVRFDEVPLAQPINVASATATSYQDKLFANSAGADLVAKKVVPEKPVGSDACKGCRTPEYFAQSKTPANPEISWSNPTTTAAVAVTQDVEKITIPQQGAVDLGDGAGISGEVLAPAPALPMPTPDVMLPSPSQTMQPGQALSTVDGYSSVPATNYTHATQNSLSYPTDYANSSHAASSSCSPQPALCSSQPGPCGCGDVTCDSPGSCGSVASGPRIGFGPRVAQVGSQDCQPGGHALANAGCLSCGSKSCLGGCGLIGKISKYVKVNPNASCSGWFAGGYYLNLGRDDDNWGSTLASSGGIDALSTGSARMGRASGVGVRVGKMLNQNNAFEVVYWQVFPQDEVGFTAASLTGNPIDTSQSFGGLTYDDGFGATPLDSIFQGAQSMAVKRKFDYQNFELNFLRLPFNLTGANGRATLALVAGFRYFEGSEGFELFADPFNETRGDDPASEVSYFVDVENQLAGLQVGGLGSYQLTDKLYGQLGTKVGLYNNHMKQRQTVSGGNGFGMLGTSKFDVASDKNDLAFLAEVDAGLAYSFTQNWRLNVGYKLVAVSSYADATSQMLRNFTVPNAKDIQDNNSLILHGLFIGAEYAF